VYAISVSSTIRSYIPSLHSLYCLMCVYSCMCSVCALPVLPVLSRCIVKINVSKISCAYNSGRLRAQVFSETSQHAMDIKIWVKALNLQFSHNIHTILHTGLCMQYHESGSVSDVKTKYWFKSPLNSHSTLGKRFLYLFHWFTLCFTHSFLPFSLLMSPFKQWEKV